MNDGDVSELSDALQKLKLLNSISILFVGCKEITDKGLEYLAEAIASFNYAIVVGLTFKEGVITDQGLGSLSQSLSRCFSLNSLYLDFEECYKITDTGLGYLSQALTRLNSLKTLSIKLDWCKSITDQGFNLLCQGIYKVGMLNSLDLSFYTCRNLTDQSLNLIPQCLAKSLSLQSLTLNFSWLESITDSGVEQVSLLISRLSYIQTLVLKFDGCTNLTDHSLAQLGVAIARSGANNLKDLSVSFDGCKQMSDTGVTVFAQNIQKLSQLKKLNMSFKECWKLTKASLQQIYLQISKIAFNISLKIFHGWKSATSYAELAELFKDESSYGLPVLPK